MNTNLYNFCSFISPPHGYSSHCDKIVQSLFQLLQMCSQFPVTHCVLGGGLPSAKNTSTCLKADADITVFVLWSGDVNPTRIPLQKELILDDWWRILFHNTTPDNPDDIIHRTANSLHFVYQDVSVDLLVGLRFHPNEARHRSHVLSLLRVAHRLVLTQYRKVEMTRLIKCLGSELTGDGVNWMRRKSKFVINIARLCKFWSQTVLYNGCGNGKSFFIELVAVSAAEMEEKEGWDIPDYASAFKLFLLKILNLDELRVIFLGVFKLEDIPSQLIQKTPLLINPVNPFQNMFECIDSDYAYIMKSAANVTLNKLQSGSEYFVDLFQPQNCDNLQTIIILKSHYFYKLSSVSSINFMPSLKFISWIKPVLNRSKEKILKDSYKETRYLIERVTRLVTAVQTSTQFSTDQFDPLPMVVDKLQCLFSKLSQTQVTLRHVTESVQDIVRDVILTLPCGGAVDSLVVAFNVVLPWNMA